MVPIIASALTHDPDVAANRVLALVVLGYRHDRCWNNVSLHFDRRVAFLPIEGFDSMLSFLCKINFPHPCHNRHNDQMIKSVPMTYPFQVFRELYWNVSRQRIAV